MGRVVASATMRPPAAERKEKPVNTADGAEDRDSTYKACRRDSQLAEDQQRQRVT